MTFHSKRDPFHISLCLTASIFPHTKRVSSHSSILLPKSNNFLCEWILLTWKIELLSKGRSEMDFALRGKTDAPRQEEVGWKSLRVKESLWIKLIKSSRSGQSHINFFK